MNVDKNYITGVLQKLVRINSVNPELEEGGAGEKEISNYLADELSALGVEVTLDEIAPGRFNVTGFIPGTGGGKSLMLNAHTDTVGTAGMQEPFSGRIEGGKLYGRGAYDMKASIAAILGAAKKLTESAKRPAGDVILSFVADEEYESIGARALVEKVYPNAAIVAEPTDLLICTAHRGFGVYKLTTRGKTAHGGRHRQGVDANAKMARLLAELSKLADRLPDEKKHALCGEASMHFPLISGGRSLFIYSHECNTHAERRTIPGENRASVEKEIRDIINQMERQEPGFSAELETIIWREPYEISADAEIVRALGRASAHVLGAHPGFTGHTWWEDSAVFGKAGIETVIMGPKGGGIHENTEWVELESVFELTEILYQTAFNYCGSNG